MHEQIFRRVVCLNSARQTEGKWREVQGKKTEIMGGRIKSCLAVNFDRRALIHPTSNWHIYFRTLKSLYPYQHETCMFNLWTLIRTSLQGTHRAHLQSVGLR
jgi:hypothetical protein